MDFIFEFPQTEMMPCLRIDLGRFLLLLQEDYRSANIWLAMSSLALPPKMHRNGLATQLFDVAKREKEGDVCICPS